MEQLGLDIGTSHIKLVSIDNDKGKKLRSYAVAPVKDLGPKIMSDSERDWIEAATYLKLFLKENSVVGTQVVAVVPDNKIFTKVISMPYLEGKELQTAVQWEAEQHLPQPLSEVSLKYTPLNLSQTLDSKQDKSKLSQIKDLSTSANNDQDKKEKTLEILLIAVPKITVNKYLTILNKAGLEPVGLEPSSLSSIRSSTLNDLNVPSLIMNFGYSTVNFYLTVNNTLRFVRTINFAVSSLTKAIRQNLDVAENAANEYLFTYGLNETELGGKIRQMILPIIKIIVEEIIKSKQFVETRPNLIGDPEQNRIKRIILSGGGALIPEIMVYLVQQLDCEIEVAKTWEGVDISGMKNRTELEMLSPLFVPAVGAALKEV